MVALEGGMKTKSGEVYNDLPDRISDSLVLVAAGYAVPGFPYGPVLGWCAALLAALTAYVRMLGGAAGLPQSFIGPMAKQQRMALLTAACVLSIFETEFLPAGALLWICLIVVNAGGGVTVVGRTVKIGRWVESQWTGGTDGWGTWWPRARAGSPVPPSDGWIAHRSPASACTSPTTPAISTLSCYGRRCRMLYACRLVPWRPRTTGNPDYGAA